MSTSKGAVAELVGADMVTLGPDAELWHRVALGELSADEAEAELLMRHPEVSDRQRAEIRRAKQVFKPPSDERRKAALEALLARRAEQQRGADSGDYDPVGDEPVAVGPRTDGSAVVVPMRRHPTRRWVVGLSVAAAAVLTVLLVRPSDSHKSFPGGYELEFDNMTATKRGSPESADVPTFVRGGKIGIRLVPEDSVTGPVDVVMYAERQGLVHRLEVDSTVHDNGVVEISTTVDAIGLGKGEWELVVAVGWVDALPESSEDVVVAEEADEVQVVRKRVWVVEDP